MVWKRVVAWIKADTKAILAIHEHVITNNARLSVTHNDQNTWTLNIRGARKEDGGVYMCQVNTNPMKSQSAFLEVVIPPDIISEETSNDLMVPEGGSAKLVCKARGYPKPEIVWKREDGSEIISRGGSTGGRTKTPTAVGELLVLSKITRSEMGAYLCIASNGVPPSVSKRIMLHVHFHPMVQVPNQLVGAPTATNVTLVCHVEASPKAINYWTRESGEMIISNSKYSMSETKTSSYSVQMKLIIMNLQKQDYGGYRCISKNSIGDAEGSIGLYYDSKTWVWKMFVIPDSLNFTINNKHFMGYTSIVLGRNKLCCFLELPKHSKKIGDRRGGDENMNESMNERDHRIHHIYQGSLREPGSTMDPSAVGGEDSASSTFSPPERCSAIILWIFLHLVTNRILVSSM
ncbi:hypothetical protein M0804_014283 [Polistes exclamans]|nr:hypothetical protein M0804_014285 [Polistes exclamans]KAI4475475.1 hypothetical protein M0804_014283 [Polistes exclamans]